jgi:DNA (cytosine-5)-methyltransferase 1
MLLSLAEYARIHNKSGDTLRRMAERGIFRTARKMGRNWVVDSTEEYPVRKRALKKRAKIHLGTVISLFSGCGGMDLGFVGGFDFLGSYSLLST